MLHKILLWNFVKFLRNSIPGISFPFKCNKLFESFPNSIIQSQTKKSASFVRKIEQFYFFTFFRISHSFAGNEFFDFVKTVLMNKTRNVGQKCLVNELVLFYAIKKCAKAQSNLIIFSKVIVFTDQKQTDTGVKIVFSYSRGPKEENLKNLSLENSSFYQSTNFKICSKFPVDPKSLNFLKLPGKLLFF